MSLWMGRVGLIVPAAAAAVFAIGTVAGCNSGEGISNGGDGSGGGTASATEGGSVGNTGPVSGSSASPTSDDSVDDGTSEDTSEDTSENTSEDTSGDTAGPVGSCSNWAPVAGGCGDAGVAAASVSGDLFSDMQDTPCRIASVVNVDATTDTVQIDCGEVYTLDFSTSDPHLNLPFVGGTDVLVTATSSKGPALSGHPSFAIRGVDGELLLGRINELDLKADISLDPIVFAITASGCPAGGNLAAQCEAQGSIVRQRRAVEFGDGDPPIVLFDGNNGITSTAGGDFAIIVDRARAIVCWAPDCAGDDSGPFDELGIFVVVLPSA